MTTLPLSQQTLFDETELSSTPSAEASPARTLAMLESALASRARALASGENTGDLLASYDPASFSWRTSQACLVSGWTPFSETFPRSGMMRGGKLYQLPPLALRTAGTACGSWPTPQASDNKQRGTMVATANRIAKGKQINLEAYVKMWPTPTTRDWKDGSAEACQNVLANGLLGRVVHQWPTPRAQSARGSGPSRVGNKADLQTQVGGSLNPDWVEWLMGFPISHTQVPGWKNPKVSRASRRVSKTEPQD
jgi:hypothetical protein